jgi:magnesium and cobalt exporter, CNNM family
MTGIVTEVLMIALLIAINAFFAMSELVVVSARKSKLQEWAKMGNRRAHAALELAITPSKFMLAMQVGITLSSILAGAIAGGSLADTMSAYLETLPLVSPYHRQVGLALVVIVIVFIVLVLGELAPKRLALRQPEMIATFISLPVRWVTKLSTPLLQLLNFSTEAICRLLGKPTGAEPPVTEEEIKTLLRQGTEAGVFEEAEQTMMEAVLRLGDKTARSLMTPRTQIAWLDLDSSAEKLRTKIISSGHSCLPVGAGSLDKVTGVVHAKDLLALDLRGSRLDFKTALQEPLFVPRSVSVLEILDAFKQSGQHLALVVDEYGGIEGLLTHHDVLEAIAGDLPLDGKPSDPKAIQRHDGSWLLDGMLSVDEFKEIFGLERLPGEKRDAYQTLGGFIFTRMERVPSVSETFEWNGLRFEIADMDGKRIDKVLVSKVTYDSEKSSTSLPLGSD